MAFKASKLKSGLFEIHGLEAYFEQKVAELRAALGLKPAAKKAAAPVVVAKKKKAARAPQPPGAPYNRGWYVHREEEESRALSAKVSSRSWQRIKRSPACASSRSICRYAVSCCSPYRPTAPAIADA